MVVCGNDAEDFGSVPLGAHGPRRIDESGATACDPVFAEENRVLRAQLGNRRLRLTDDQRRSLAAKARLPGRKMLSELATIVTPETLLRWHRKLIADKYDGSAQRRPGRLVTQKEIEALVVRMATENRDWGYLRI
jgi:transposase-like protein